MSTLPYTPHWVWPSRLKILEWAQAAIAYSPQCRQWMAFLLLQLQMIMHIKCAIYSSNNSIFNYRTSGHNKGILLTHETSCHNPWMFIFIINFRAIWHLYIITSNGRVARSVWKFHPNCLQKLAQFDIPTDFILGYQPNSIVRVGVVDSGRLRQQLTPARLTPA